MDRCRDLRPMYAAFAADSASRADAMRIQLHLGDGCAACAVEIEQLMESYYAIPLGLTPRSAPEGSRDSLLEEIARTPQEQHEVPVLFPETDRLRLWKVLTALSAVAVIAVAWWGKTQTDGIEQIEGEAARARMMGTVDTRSLERQVGQLSETLQSAASPRADVINLAGEGRVARIFLDAASGVATLSSEALGDPGDGNLHHVWLVQGDTPTLLGRIPPGFSREGGQIRFRVEQAVDGASGLLTLDPSAQTPETPGETVLSAAP
ncbi:MAG: anti-sigma factor [Deltaproteobacteria bacterium]|nr:anti-sigma factor [Deltaproteobacteria bacterium]